MWIDESADAYFIRDFDALYHGDVLVEGNCDEQFEDVA